MTKFFSILGYFQRYWRITLFSAAMMSLFEVIDLFVPYATGQILNLISQQPVDAKLQQAIDQIAQWLDQPVSQQFSLMVLVALIGLVTVGRAPIQPWLGGWFSWDTAFRARRDHAEQALKKILTLPLEYYDENNPGRIAAKVAKGLSNFTWTYPGITSQFIPKTVRIIGIFVVIALIDWRIASIVLISVAGIFLHSFMGLKDLSVREERLDAYIENTDSRNSEIITNIKTVKAFGNELSELHRQTQRLDREFKILDYRIHKGYTVLSTYQRTIVQSCMFLVLTCTLWLTVNGKISIGHFITTLTVASMAYAEVDPICEIAEMFARRYAPMSRFQEFTALPVSCDAGALLPNGPTYQFTGKVHFHNLTFGYNPAKPVLNNIELLIEPYKTVALVGRSGSGKSTLVKLLFRYFEPNSGGILIDGKDIRQLDVTGYRKRLAIVHQEVDIFNGTLMENLLYGNPAASFEEIKTACEIAQAHDFIQQLPKGYFTTVGERGVRLSGGQRQRIGIARALIVKPDVLVFDEATSSLDYESERAIQVAMRSLFGTCTLIIIAHRLSTVRDADKIVVLDQGSISQVGNHDELLEEGGLYQRLHALQESGELMD
ncbi:MAG: ABC transporter ATP-binding protein [Phormidesmis sp. RL_2_1]|nr:ABC transporter ATP-binding protein [Phormidesmis sp. RL_2_1]